MPRRSNGDMGRVTVEVSLANNQDVQLAARGALPADQVRRQRLSALVNTGANYLVLPEPVAKQLGLPPAQPVLVRFADGRMEFRDVVAQVALELFGRQGTFQAIVEPNRNDALIGAIVLESLDLLVDCSNQTLHPRDPKQIIAEIGW